MDVTEDLEHFLRKLGLSALLVVLLLAAWMLRHVLLLAFGAVLFCVFLEGLTRQFQKRAGLPRGAALGMVIFLLVVLLAVGGWFLGTEVAGQFQNLRERIDASWAQWQEVLRQYSWGRALLTPSTTESLTTNNPALLSRLTGWLGNLFSALSGALIVLVMGLYLAVDPDLYKKGALHLFPPRYRPRLGEILEALWLSMIGWLIGRAFSMVVIGVGTGIGLWLLGMPMALALGIFAFAITFIPYVGPILSAVPAVLVASTMGTNQLLWVLGLYVVLQLIETNLLTPNVDHWSVSVPPALSVGAEVAGGVLLGPLGLMFATPLVTVLLVLVKMLYVEDTLGDEIATPGHPVESS